MRLKDIDKSDSGALLLAEGFHYLNNGSLYLLAAPDGYVYANDTSIYGVIH